MLKDLLLKKAIKYLTATEKELLGLLTAPDHTKADILNFLHGYDIDSEKASDTFLINELLERYDISEEESPLIPRIKGVKEFYRFHNINALKTLTGNAQIYDVDLFLRLTNKDTVRPFTPNDILLNDKNLSDLLGHTYAGKITNSLRDIKTANNTFRLPDEKYLTDLLFIRIYYSIIYKELDFNYACYIYDILRYSGNTCPGINVYFFIIRRSTRHFFGYIYHKFFKHST